jgi:hypothetical protein
MAKTLPWQVGAGYKGAPLVWAHMSTTVVLRKQNAELVLHSAFCLVMTSTSRTRRSSMRGDAGT